MMIKWEVTIPKLTGDTPRKAYVYLPDYYNDDPNRRFPVMYMFDGHNVFFDADATYGKSWGMYDFMSWTRKPLIIVAVECNQQGQRFSEYAPVTYENKEHGYIKGKGIDEHYRTLPDRANTMICGSSMGGLMALYAAACYNKVFQRAACLSPSLWVDASQIYNLIARGDIKNDTTIYMDYGSEEINNHEGNADALISMAQLLLKKRVNLTFRIVPGGTHSEASWEKQIPVFMDCLGL